MNDFPFSFFFSLTLSNDPYHEAHKKNISIPVHLFPSLAGNSTGAEQGQGPCHQSRPKAGCKEKMEGAPEDGEGTCEVRQKTPQASSNQADPQEHAQGEAQGGE